MGDGLSCNVARLRTVAGLAVTNRAVNKIAAAYVIRFSCTPISKELTILDRNDPAAEAAVAAAKAGLKEAQGGIGQIATALVAGLNPPEAGRVKTEAGLDAAKTALAGIAGT